VIYDDDDSVVRNLFVFSFCGGKMYFKVYLFSFSVFPKCDQSKILELSEKESDDITLDSKSFIFISLLIVSNAIDIIHT
jgi:hypothetical protein